MVGGTSESVAEFVVIGAIDGIWDFNIMTFVGAGSSAAITGGIEGIVGVPEPS
ncbi:hypothetical protein NKH18_45330 [Streptomyces sp. M10(2022)]